MGKKKNLVKENSHQNPTKLVDTNETVSSNGLVSNHYCNGGVPHVPENSKPNPSQNLSNGAISKRTSQIQDFPSDRVIENSQSLEVDSFCQKPTDANSDDVTESNEITDNNNDVTPNSFDGFENFDDLTQTIGDVTYIVYESELQMPDIMRLIQKDLSEPYSIYTYRYFIHNWPHLCFMARVGEECVGAIVCKLDYHKKLVKRGYIAMLAVDSSHRKKKIGSTLVKKAIQAMIAEEADEVVLETEITNKPALRLYENLGFVRDKRLFRYYLNGVDALRLKLWLR